MECMRFINGGVYRDKNYVRGNEPMGPLAGH